jgi:hypothetical protein
MNLDTQIVEISADNISEHPGVICFTNPRHEFYHKKIDWLNEQFEKGLRIKLLYLKGEKKPAGFIEYVPGEYCWRSVDAKGYMVIHCLWTNGKRHQHQGLGTLLIEEVENDARHMRGVSVVTSDKSFMCTREIFIKNGYATVSESGKDQLLAKQFSAGPLPSLNDWRGALEKYEGLSIVYSRQCPWVARFMQEVKPILQEKNLEPVIVELKTSLEAQNAPSIYSVFNLIYNGRMLADRYISTTRFLNIMKKEIK